MVREVAVERAVMAAVSNSNILGMLGQVTSTYSLPTYYLLYKLYLLHTLLGTY